MIIPKSFLGLGCVVVTALVVVNFQAMMVIDHDAVLVDGVGVAPLANNYNINRLKEKNTGALKINHQLTKKKEETLLLDQELGWLPAVWNQSTRPLKEQHPKVKVSLPILVVGLPKAGTSSIYSYFNQTADLSVSHYRCVTEDRIPTIWRPYHRLCGVCIRDALRLGRSNPLATCGGWDVWTQMDVEKWDHCYFPQILDLEALHREAPHATLVLNKRNVTKWVASVTKWGSRRKMSTRLATRCPDGQGPASGSAQNLTTWYNDHIERIRNFTKTYHPMHALIEIDIDDPQAGDIMEKHFGIPSSQWGHANEMATNPKVNQTLAKLLKELSKENNDNKNG